MHGRPPEVSALTERRCRRSQHTSMLEGWTRRPAGKRPASSTRWRPTPSLPPIAAEPKARNFQPVRSAQGSITDMPERSGLPAPDEVRAVQAVRRSVIGSAVATCRDKYASGGVLRSAAAMEQNLNRCSTWRSPSSGCRSRWIAKIRPGGHASMTRPSRKSQHHPSAALAGWGARPVRFRILCR